MTVETPEKPAMEEGLHELASGKEAEETLSPPMRAAKEQIEDFEKFCQANDIFFEIRVGKLKNFNKVEDWENSEIEFMNLRALATPEFPELPSGLLNRFQAAEFGFYNPEIVHKAAMAGVLMGLMSGEDDAEGDEESTSNPSS